MVVLNSVIQKFEKNGEKTGWAYIEIPQQIAQKIKPDTKKSFRVKGFLDNLEVAGIALLPMGQGHFILPINGVLKKLLGKKEGQLLHIKLEEHQNYELLVPNYLVDCFAENKVLVKFNTFTKSHRDYFVKWIIAAKTPETQAKRIANTIDALLQNKNYGEMIRNLKNQ